MVQQRTRDDESVLGQCVSYAGLKVSFQSESAFGARLTGHLFTAFPGWAIEREYETIDFTNLRKMLNGPAYVDLSSISK